MASGLSEPTPESGERKLLALYEYEACPFCAKVREALTVLDLDYLAYPTPRETLKQYGLAKQSRIGTTSRPSMAATRSCSRSLWTQTTTHL